MSPISMTNAPDGTQLATYRWAVGHNTGHGRAVYLLHGLSEYAGRYEHVAGWLNARGWQVGAHDHRGHGRSGGQRATLRRPEDLILDAEQQIRAYTQETGTSPVLLGHSMGGLVAAHIALRGNVELAGLVMVSPAMRLHITKSQRLLAKAMNAIAPNLRIRHFRRQPKLSHDQAATDTYLSDPLVNRVITPRLAQFIEAGGPGAIHCAAVLAVRTLLLVAGDDQVVDSAGSREFANAAPPGKLALRWYDNAWHELLNETAEIANPVYADLDAWLADM